MFRSPELGKMSHLLGEGQYCIMLRAKAMHQFQFTVIATLCFFMLGFICY